ncbi:MAG: VanZ family protein [Anaerotruncus sp.]|nr:VanZ family protein [Anaerotruncus sp.]
MFGRALAFTIQALTTAFPLWLCWLAGRLCWLKLRRQKIISLREFWLTAFVGYLLCLLAITIWRYGIGTSAQRIVNLLPIVALIGLPALDLFYNIVGNIVWFVPFGLLLPLAFPQHRAFQRAVFWGAGCSALIELSQYLLATGIADLDDLLFNTIGAALGWCAYKLLFGLRLK